MTQLAAIADILNAWIYRSGDVYISSLINTALYAFSIVASIYRWRKLKQINVPVYEQRFWISVIFILLALGINKQLDFQVLLTELGRPIAKAEGWFEYRRLVQVWFAYILSGIIGSVSLLILFLTRKLWRYNALALIGLLILCIYTVFEIMSLSHVGFDANPGSTWGFRLTDIVEMLGILFIFINAVISIKKD